MAYKTAAWLEVSYPGERPTIIETVKEFSYSSEVMGVGELCSITVVADEQGEMLGVLRLGSDVKLRLKNPGAADGNWTLKHWGRIVTIDADAKEGTIRVTSADLGWHLMNCHGELWRRLRGRPLDAILNPNADNAFVDPSFGFVGIRAGKDSNLLNRTIKLGKAGLRPPGTNPLSVPPVIQIEPGETIYDVITKYLQRYNKLVNVSVDRYLQIWNPNYDRKPLYDLTCKPGESYNVIAARRHDDASTRYTEVTCVGEIVIPPIDQRRYDPTNPNFNKVRGHYRAALAKELDLTGAGRAAGAVSAAAAAAGVSGIFSASALAENVYGSSDLPAPLPFTNRLTFGDGEMFDREMAKGQAEWRWKRGMFDSHYLHIEVVDHYHDGNWWESDELVDVDIPALGARGVYYIQNATCNSTVTDGDTTTLTLRWTHLLSASFGEWRDPPTYRIKADRAAVAPGKGSGQG